MENNNFTADQIASACMDVNITDSQYESLMIALHYAPSSAQRAASVPAQAGQPVVKFEIVDGLDKRDTMFIDAAKLGNGVHEFYAAPVPAASVQSYESGYTDGYVKATAEHAKREPCTEPDIGRDAALSGERRAAIHRKVLERGIGGPDVVGPTVCTVPPAGWHCTRAPGHDGPCAAIPVSLPNEDQIDQIARSYFAEEYGQTQVKNAIHDALSALATQAAPEQKGGM